MTKKAEKKVTKKAEVKEEVKAPEPVATVLSEKAPLGSKARRMRDKLALQPKVRIMIPLAGGEKLGVTQSVILNEYPMYIRKGGYVEVPEQVADVLQDKLKQRVLRDNHPNRLKGDGVVPLTTYGG